MTNVQKNEIVKAIHKESKRLGSNNKVANHCDVSGAMISQMVKHNWEKISTGMWQKVAGKLHVNFSGWQIAQTSNFKMLFQVFNDAKTEKLFIPVSNKAGSGKSAVANTFADLYSDDAVYHIHAREWAKREFIYNLMKLVGIDRPKGAITIDELGQKVIDFFEERSHLNPLLIINEADKLKAPALRFLIPFSNALEDKVGLVLLGTENLKKEIKNGVRLNRKGYDEIDSRLGRNYITLIGATKTDVQKICDINGIKDRTIQNDIFKECNPISKVVNKSQVTVVEDMRRVKRSIKRELLKATV